MQLFISYPNDVGAWAQQLAGHLRRHGMVVTTEADIPPGSVRQEEISRLMEDASDFLVVVGPNSQTSPWLDFQWRLLQDELWSHPEKRVMPVLFGDSSGPSFLQSWQAIHVNPKKDVAAMTRVADAIQNWPPRSRALARARQARLERLGGLAVAVESVAGEPDGPTSDAEPLPT